MSVNQFSLLTGGSSLWTGGRDPMMPLGRRLRPHVCSFYTESMVGVTRSSRWTRYTDEHDLSVCIHFSVKHMKTGGSHEGYCKWACAAAAARGWRAIVLNYRGCNGVPLTAPRGYAATMTHDVARAISSIKGWVVRFHWVIYQGVA